MFNSLFSSARNALTFRAIDLNLVEVAVDKHLPGATPGDPSAAFGLLLGQVLNIALIAGTIAVFFFLLLGGIEWITAGGDSAKITKAREKITNAIIGLVVLVSTVAIMLFVQSLLGFCAISFGGVCGTPSNPGQTSQPPAAAPLSCTGTCIDTPLDCAQPGTGACQTGRYCCQTVRP